MKLNNNNISENRKLTNTEITPYFCLFLLMRKDLNLNSAIF